MNSAGDTFDHAVAVVARKFGQRMSNESACLDMNDELWLFRGDYTTLPVTMSIFAVFYAFIIVFGVFGNICVVLAISRTKSLQTVPNLFILSLSCSDLVVCCISATITPITAFKKEWYFGSALCSIAPWIAGISLCFSTFTLTAISIDRYMLIRYPMKKPLTKNQALMIIGMICVLSAAISAPTALKQKLSDFEAFCGKYCTEDWGEDQRGRKVYGAIMLGVQFVVPLTIIIISYAAISLRIGQSMILKGTQKNGSPEYEWQATLTDQQRIALKRRQRTNRMLIAMVFAFSASWFWSVAFNVLRDYDGLPDYVKSQEYLFGIGTHCIAMTSTVWNPLLYAMLNLQLRAAFIRLMPDCLRRRLGPPADFEKTSPLINGHGEQSMAANRGTVKYGATQRDTLGLPTNGCAPTLTISQSKHSISSRRGSHSSRKLSAIRVIVSKLSSGVSDAGDEDDLEFLMGDSSEDSDQIQKRRRRSTACIVRPLSSMAVPAAPSFPLLISRKNIVFRPKNETESTYEVHLSVNKSLGLRIQYSFERKGNGTNTPQDIIRFGTNMKGDLTSDDITSYYEVRNVSNDDIRTERHQLLIRLLDNGYKINWMVGDSMHKVYRVPYTVPYETINEIGLQGQIKLKTYQHWIQPNPPYQFDFPTQSNIFPVGDKICVIADLQNGSDFKIDILTANSSVVAFRWQMSIVHGLYVVSNNLHNLWSGQKTSFDCGIENIPWKTDAIVKVILSNTESAFDVDVQIGPTHYNCTGFFRHDGSVDMNTGYRSVLVTGDVAVLQVARILEF